MIDNSFIIEQRNISYAEISSQQSQLYDYLLMKYTLLLGKKNSNDKNQQCQYLNTLYYESDEYHNVLSLFVHKQKSQKQKIFVQFYTKKHQNQLKQQWELLKILIQRYPSVFTSILNSQVSWEDVILHVIKKESLKHIFSHYIKSMANEMHEFESSFNQFLVYVNFLLATLLLDEIIKNKFNKQKRQIIENVKNLIKIEIEKFQNDISISSITHQQKNEIIGNIRLMLFQRLYKAFQIQVSEEEKLTYDFQRNYRDFVKIYQVQEGTVNTKIFQLHYVQQLLQNCQQFSQQSSQLTYSFDNQENDRTYSDQKLKNINVFNFQKTENQQKLVLNKSFLRSFIKFPYQTSLFVLYTLMSCSDYKNFTRFFDNSKSMKFIDPMLYLLVKSSLINNLNIESVSLSLWIMTEIWLNYTENEAKQRCILSKETLIQSQKTSKLRDPRKIYTINQEAYSSIPVPGNVSSQKPSMNSMQQFQNIYKRPLMHTLSMFLLTLNVPSTMLKYYCIENDLLRDMSLGDVLPSLLVRNQYLFNTSLENLSIQKVQLDFQQEFKAKISNAKTLEELQQLEKEYQQRKSVKNSQNWLSEEINFFQKQIQQPLPWLQIIESKQFLLPLLNKPSGYELILKIIEKNPRYYLKLYETYLFKMICSQVEKKNYEQMMQNKENKTSDRQQYRFQGNKNVKLKKSIIYFPQVTKQSSTKISNINETKQQKEKEKKFIAIKNILGLFKSHYNHDENVKNNCNQLLKYL